jgi:hypothetical protein
MKSLNLVESIDVFERRSEFDSLVYVARIVIDGRVFETFEHVEKESSLFELFEIVENNVEDVEEIEKYFDMIEEFIAKEIDPKFAEFARAMYVDNGIEIIEDSGLFNSYHSFYVDSEIEENEDGDIEEHRIFKYRLYHDGYEKDRTVYRGYEEFDIEYYSIKSIYDEYVKVAGDIDE